MSTVSTPPASSSPDEIIRYRYQIELPGLSKAAKMDSLREAVIDARAAEDDFRRCGMSIAASDAAALAMMATRQLDDLRLETEGGAV